MVSASPGRSLLPVPASSGGSGPPGLTCDCGRAGVRRAGAQLRHLSTVLSGLTALGKPLGKEGGGNPDQMGASHAAGRGSFFCWL